MGIHPTMRRTWTVTSYLGTFRFMRGWDVLPEEVAQVVHPLEARSALTTEASRGAFALADIGGELRGGYRPAHYNVRTHQRELLKELLEAIDSKRLVAIKEPPPRPPVMVPSEDAPSEPPPKPAQKVREAPPRDRYLRLRLVSDTEPRASKDYVLRLDDGSQRPGRTSSDGLLVEKLPPHVRSVRVQLESVDFGLEDHLVTLDALNPTSHVRGVQERLRNAGLLTSEAGERLDERTRLALARFGERHELTGPGEVSAGAETKTKAKLEEVHGS